MTTGQEKYAELVNVLKGLNKVVVAFSGGVDSTLMSAGAYAALGNNAIAVTAVSPTMPEWEIEDAKLLAQEIGITHLCMNTNEMADPDFTANRPDHCYYCKRIRFGALADWTKKNGYKWIVDGSNMDDTRDYRPGMKALEEISCVRSPFLEVKMTKQDIRDVSKSLGLSSWNKQSAACLASRIAYGLPLTKAALQQVAVAENFIRPLVTGQLRVRSHGDIARIEVNEKDSKILLEPACRYRVNEKLKELGFTYITLDLGGYRMGSLNNLKKSNDE